MTQYLISFDDGAMNIPADELSDVSAAGMEVVRAAREAGVWVVGVGVERQTASVVGVDGTVADKPPSDTAPFVGGFAIVDVPSREEALAWAARIAVACRCAQEVRELLSEPPG